jgi:hypothetical protein
MCLSRPGQRFWAPGAVVRGDCPVDIAHLLKSDSRAEICIVVNADCWRPPAVTPRWHPVRGQPLGRRGRDRAGSWHWTVAAALHCVAARSPRLVVRRGATWWPTRAEAPPPEFGCVWRLGHGPNLAWKMSHGHWNRQHSWQTTHDLPSRLSASGSEINFGRPLFVTEYPSFG